MGSREQLGMMYILFGINGERRCKDCKYCRKPRKDCFCSNTSDWFRVEPNDKACGEFKPKENRA